MSLFEAVYLFFVINTLGLVFAGLGREFLGRMELMPQSAWSWFAALFMYMMPFTAWFFVNTGNPEDALVVMTFYFVAAVTAMYFSGD